jgi:hypothetical protein
MATVEIPAGTVEALERVLSYLVGERQRLRSDEANRVELEANRRAIVAIQNQLSQAHGRRHGSKS